MSDTVVVLKMWRELAGLNQRELALLAGIHYTTISDYETGKTAPQVETVARVSAALGMTATDREEAESYVHRTCFKLRSTVVLNDPPGLPSSSREFAALRKQLQHTAQEVCWLGLRLVVLLVDLLIRIAERGTGEGDPGKPGAEER